jgi:hypothetical protein
MGGLLNSYSRSAYAENSRTVCVCVYIYIHHLGDDHPLKNG